MKESQNPIFSVVQTISLLKRWKAFLESVTQVVMLRNEWALLWVQISNLFQLTVSCSLSNNVTCNWLICWVNWNVINGLLLKIQQYNNKVLPWLWYQKCGVVPILFKSILKNKNSLSQLQFGSKSSPRDLCVAPNYCACINYAVQIYVMYKVN